MSEEKKQGFGQRNKKAEKRGAKAGRGARGGRVPKSVRKAREETAKDTWIPVTKLGRLVKEKKINSLEEIYLHSLPIKEYQIVDYFLKDKLKDEVMKISPVQKQTAAGQRTKFKAFVIIGDKDGHCGLGTKVSSEVATAIRGAIILAKLSLVPVRRGYWGTALGEPHTVPVKITGKCGSVKVRLIPAPRGTGIVAAPVPKKLLEFAGIKDVFTQSEGHTKTLGNFLKATFKALAATYSFLTPDLWGPTHFTKTPYQEFTDLLAESAKKKVIKSEEEQQKPRRGRQQRQ